MALHKTDYGLVYDDEGSLCVTKRTDDVPFPGTTAWAVEEGTTNVITNPLPDGTANWSKSDNNGSVSTLTYDGNEKCLVLEVTATGSGYPRLTSNSFGPFNILSLSFYAKADANGKQLKANFYEGGSTKIYSTHTLTTTWQRYTYSIDTTYNLNRMYFVPNAVGTYYIKLIQVEALPFATSFVDGTRADGILKKSQPVIDINNFVINTWIMNTRYPSQTNKWLHVYDISIDSSNYQGLEFAAPPYTVGSLSPNHLCLTYRTGQSSQTRYDLNYDLSTEIHKWHMLTFVGNNNELKAYVDAEVQATCIHNFSKTNNEFIIFGRWFGNVSGTGRENGFLLADPYIGKAIEDSNLVWTDDYVRQVYDMKSSFFVPPRAIVH